MAFRVLVSLTTKGASLSPTADELREQLHLKIKFCLKTVVETTASCNIFAFESTIASSPKHHGVSTAH